MRSLLVARHLLRTPVQRRWGAQLARIEAGVLALDVAPFDLRALIANVCELMRVRAEAKALWLRWSDPGQAAAQGPGQRAMPEPVAAEQPAPGSGRGTVVTAVLVVVAAAAGWVLHSLMR